MKLSALLEGLYTDSLKAAVKWHKHPTRKGILVRHGAANKEEELARIRKFEQEQKRRASGKLATPKLDYTEIAHKIESAVSNSVPDGDPIDWLIPYFQKRGIDYDIVKHLNKAIRSTWLKDSKSWDGYLRDMWDSYYESTAKSHEEYMKLKKENPWR